MAAEGMDSGGGGGIAIVEGLRERDWDQWSHTCTQHPPAHTNTHMHTPLYMHTHRTYTHAHTNAYM